MKITRRQLKKLIEQAMINEQPQEEEAGESSPQSQPTDYGSAITAISRAKDMLEDNVLDELSQSGVPVDLEIENLHIAQAMQHYMGTSPGKEVRVAGAINFAIILLQACRMAVQDEQERRQ